MTLKEKILTFMYTEAYKPLTAEEIAEVLGLKGNDLTSFWSVLDELETNAEVIKTRFGKYGVPERMNLLVGTMSASDKGYGFVLPKNQEEPDVYIPVDSMMSAMHGDSVVVRLHSRRSATGKAQEGEVIRIIHRANTTIVGSFENSRHFAFVTPDENRIRQDIFIPKGEFNGAKNGSKVVVEITKWPEKKRNAEGKVIEVLGHKGDPGLEILSIIRRNNLSTSFPPEVEQAALKANTSISEEDLVGRRDLRHLPVVTIDSEDAKDLDDAVHVERLKNGRYSLGVHIADVSYYVRENTALDNEARERGTSVYLVDRVLPMLPQRLSNGICSLNAGEDRLTLSAQMEVDHQGKVLNYEIFPSVIRVHTRLSYNVVRGILVDNDAELKEKYQPLLEHINDMERLCHILRDRRMRRGAIDFDFPELKVKLDDNGKPIGIVKRVRSVAESIVEEFMLLANETVAEHIHTLAIPFVFRVHEEPEAEKMVKLDNLLHNFGQSLGKTEEVSPKALQKVLGLIAGRPEERIISTVMLRSLKQARYEAENLGHFGLAAPFYTHFTSPIRRYPDLIVHRILRETFMDGEVSAKRRQKLAAILPEIALHSSQRERAAAEAERETVDLKKVEYMAQFIGEEFDGNINGVTAFGLFVELENGIEGLVHVSSMDDDYYCYAEEQYSLIGERSGKTYRLGDAVRVLLVKVNPEERNIDFELSREDSLTPSLRIGGSKRPRKEPIGRAEPPKAGRKKTTVPRRKRRK
ncbi:MAG: rnr [Firmicutes bacterium]|nr:rnr [Bacillota bacterium]